MTFSSQVKKELCSVMNINQCCLHAQVYGLVLFAHFNNFMFSITTENKDVFSLYCDYLRNYLKCKITVNDLGTRKLTAYCEDEESKRRAFDKFGHSLNETTLRINHANFDNTCCIGAFLRGAFLSCGSVSNPKQNYHLEFVVPFKKLCSDLLKILSDLDLEPKYLYNNSKHIVYFKDSEKIEDLLAFMGAHNSSLYLMNVKIEKDVKNKVNRKLNFEICNIEKTVSAAAKQIDGIQKIQRTIGLASLPENLQNIAKLRLQNPEASLSELETLSEEKISRSGIKHRLDKILKIADEINTEEEK